MGVRYRSSTGDLGGARYLSMARELTGIIEEEMDGAGAHAQQDAQSYVNTAGTGSSWSGAFKGRTGPNAGRVDTGHMRDALDYRITRGQNVGLQVGWIRDFEDYFTAQDEGFSAPGFRRARQFVAGMGLMAHLKVYLNASVDEALDRAMRRIVSGL